MKHRYTVYADFESLLIKDEQVRNKRQLLQRHEVMSYSYIIHSSMPSEKFEPRLYTGSDAATHFLDSVNSDLETIIKPRINFTHKMIYNVEAKNAFESAVNCWICETPLKKGDEVIVRHHCHASGRRFPRSSSQSL